MPLARISQFIAEMRRRHVFRVVGIYVVAAWVILQVASLAFESFGLPTAAMRFVWYALIIVSPLAVFWGWRYDITANGIVRTPPATGAATVDASLRSPDFIIIAALAAIVLSVLAGAVNEISRLPQSVDHRYALNRDVISAIAVLPFENLSADPADKYLSAGMHDALITALARVNAFKIISRTSTLRLSDELTIPEIGERLGVDKIIEGTVTRDADEVRINIQLIDAEREEHIWSESYVRSFDSLVSLQSDIATSVASAVQVRLTPEEMRRLESRGEVNPETYDTYLRAMYRIRRETGKGMREAMDLLMDTVENDPTSALAWAGLAYGYGELGHSPFPEKDAYPRAKAAADRALELDPDLAEAHLAVAMYRMYYEWDFAAAEEAFERAIEINPSLVNAHYHLAWLYELYGMDEDALRLGELTKELDPLSPFFSGWLAEQYRDAGMPEKAIDEAEATLKLRRGYPVGLLVLGETYADLGDFEKALEYHEKLKGNFYWSFALAATLGRAGRIDEALEIAQGIEERGGASMVMVLIYASMGDYDAAYEWLLKARDDRIPWYPWLLKWYPQTEGFRDDPRVAKLAEELEI
jgi:TolB-like protein/tetratricopeptide (TPR) repeat protein